MILQRGRVSYLCIVQYITSWIWRSAMSFQFEFGAEVEVANVSVPPLVLIGPSVQSCFGSALRVCSVPLVFPVHVPEFFVLWPDCEVLESWILYIFPLRNVSLVFFRFFFLP